MADGVIVAADMSQEWLLPWWLESYQKHNSFPVAFIDLGMSFQGKKWCQSQGEHIPLRILPDFVKEREEIDPAHIASWEKTYGHWFWDSRAAWFQKPLACLKTPFERTLWIDLDCEVLAPLSPLFSYSTPDKIGIVRDQTKAGASSPFPIYNSGVISFCRNSPLIAEWAQQSMELNHTFTGDQDVLSYLIEQKPHSIAEIPPIYNWSRTLPENKEAAIVHWHGQHGKVVIRTRMHLAEIPEAFLRVPEPGNEYD